MELIYQWLTFGVMVLVQVVMAAAIITTIKTRLEVYAKEIERLRDWKHEFGPRQMVYDGWGVILQDHENRIRQVEKTK